MSELRNFHMLLLAAEYVEGNAALRADIWAEMDGADGHRRVRQRLSSTLQHSRSSSAPAHRPVLRSSSTLQHSRSPSAPAHRPVLRSSSTLQQNRSPSAPLAHEVVPRVQYRPTTGSIVFRTGVRTRSSRLNPQYRNSEPVALTMIPGFRDVPIRQETRRLTERPDQLPLALRPPSRPSQQLPPIPFRPPRPPPRPSQQLPPIPVRPSRLTHQLPPIPPRPTQQLPPLPVRPPRPAQQLPPIPVRRPVQTQQLRSIPVRRPVQTQQLLSIRGRPPVATQQLPSVPRPPRSVDNPRGSQSVAPRPPVRPVDTLRASQNRPSIPATPMSYLDKGKGKLDIELCELEVAEQLLNLRYLPMHPSNIASSSR